jgi:hypothetical protein
MTAKSLILFHLNPLYGLKASDFLNDTTSSVFQIVLQEDHFELKNLIDETEENKPFVSSSFNEVLAAAHTVVISDSMFTENSFLIETEDFLREGLPSLVKYYEAGGNVMVQCAEGVYEIGNLLSASFGTKWQLGAIESTKCIPTSKGLELLGIEPFEAYLSGKVHFMKTSPDEGIVAYNMYKNKEEFFNENDLDPDEPEDDAEESWQRYLQQYEHQHAVAFYKGGNGMIIWNGDRGQNTEMQGVFMKLLQLSSKE